MGSLNTIGYNPVKTVLHHLDPRTKQLIVMILSSVCFVGGTWFLSCVSLCILCFLVMSELGILQLVRSIRYFLLFLLIVFLLRSVTFTSDYLPVLKPDQTKGAIIFCWRLLLVVLMGVLLISSTRTSDIRAALVWLLRPVPFVNGRTAATMVGLIVRFLPLILFQAGEIGDAMRSRCVEVRKKPLYRINRFTIMLFRRAIIRADELVDTMQARCYNEHRTLRQLYFSNNDVLAAGITVALLCTLFIK